MYVRVAEVTAQSELQFKMLMAFIEKELLPRNIAAGQLSGEIFRTSSNSCFVVSRFTSKSEADKIMSIMKAELNEMKGSNKIRLIEGERILSLGKTLVLPINYIPYQPASSISLNKYSRVKSVLSKTCSLV